MLVQRFSTPLMVSLTLGLAGFLVQPGLAPSLSIQDGMPSSPPQMSAVDGDAPAYWVELGRRRSGSGHRPRLD
jgi:hypothetical protein